VSNTSITYLVAACAGVFSLAAFTAWILVPVWGAYGRVWQRLVACVLSLYVLVAVAGAGIGAGLGLFFLLGDRI